MWAWDSHPGSWVHQAGMSISCPCHNIDIQWPFRNSGNLPPTDPCSVMGHIRAHPLTHYIISNDKIQSHRQGEKASQQTSVLLNVYTIYIYFHTIQCTLSMKHIKLFHLISSDLKFSNMALWVLVSLPMGETEQRSESVWKLKFITEGTELFATSWLVLPFIAGESPFKINLYSPETISSATLIPDISSLTIVY